MADINFKIKNGLVVGDLDIVTPGGTVTLPSGTADLAPLDSPAFTGVVDFSGATLNGFESLPDQSGNSGKYLTTDGSTASWGVVSGVEELPPQTGHTGEFLTTDGTNVSWTAVSPGTLPDQTGNTGKYLTTDGTTASWSTIETVSGTSPDFSTSISLDSTVITTTSTSTITVNIATTIDTMSASSYRSAEYLVQVTQGTKYTTSKFILLHDGTTASISEYGILQFGSPSIPLTISATISAGNVLLQATITDAATTNADIILTRTALIV